MDADGLVKQAKRIIQSRVRGTAAGVLAEAREFLRVYAGPKSSFLKTLNDVNQTWSDDYIMEFVTSTLEGFIRYVENDLLEGLSIERRAQIDVVSDFLEQANGLLSTKGVHPAAPTVIIGASLEEFLRNWIEEANLSTGSKKPGIDSYTKLLREADLITKQDVKDLTSWAGLRNHAAHGEWDEVDDRKRVSIMLEGVNLFMRRHGKSNP